MARIRTTLSACALLVALCAGAAHPALPAPRPFGGCGILILRQDAGAPPMSLTLYREPGLLRLAEYLPAALPRLAEHAGEHYLAASARKGVWTRLAYDDAGRHGWLKQERGWEYLPWREFLPGRTVRVLPGMKKELYALKGEAGEGSSGIGALNRGQQVTVLQVEDDWARLQAPSGWFRWRDGDGRLTVSLQ